MNKILATIGKRASVLVENEDYFNTTLEAEDILHEIDPSSPYGEKKGKLYSFLHWQRKTRLNLFKQCHAATNS